MSRMSDDTLWSLERELWTGDAALYEGRLASEVLMVLPDPAGVLDREQTLQSISAAPRWAAVDIDERHEIRPAAQVAVLVYVAGARRAGDQSNYRARCSSTYVHDGDRWLLVLHHQTVLA
jgi:hypothetical protein